MSEMRVERVDAPEGVFVLVVGTGREGLGGIAKAVERALRMLAQEVERKTGDEKKDEQAGPNCADCGRTIEPWTTGDGRHYSAEELANRRAARYGRPLCAFCVARTKKEEGG